MGPLAAAAPIAADAGAKGAADAGASAGLGKGAADALAPAAAGGIGDVAAAGAPLDLLSFGSAAGTAIPGAAGTLEGLGTLGGVGDVLSTTAASGLPGTIPGGLAGGELALPGGATPTAFTGGQPTAAGTNPFDNLASGATPSGSPTGASVAPPASGGAGAVAPPAGVNAPVDLTSVAPTSQGGFNSIDAAAGVPGVNGAPAAPTSGNFLTNLLGTTEASVAKNPLGTALAAGGLGYNLLQGQKQSAAVNALSAEAAQAASTGTTLQSYLTSGTLPPALQAQVSQATAAAKARILANYQNTPGGADPSKNSALAQELNNLEISAIAAAGKIEQDLATQGLSASGLASNIYSQLAQIDATQTANMGKAIASFAAALSPTKGLTISTGA